MPANKYTKALYKSGTIKNERMAEMLRERAKSPMPKEGTTNPGGGRPAAASKMMAPKAAPKLKPMPKAPQVIRTTTMMKPSPATKKK